MSIGREIWLLSLLALAGIAWRARPLAHWLVRRRDRIIGGDSGYVHEIIDQSLLAFAVFAAVTPFTSFRRRLPVECWHAVRIVATRAADCGSCLQIMVNLARADGLSGELIRALLDRQSLPPDLADAVSFTEQIMTQHAADGDVRSRMLERYGALGMTELAYAIASSQIFPYTKQALGHGISCAQVQVR